MHSEFLKPDEILARSPAYRRLCERVEQRKRDLLDLDEWQRQNAELSFAWAEAICEDWERGRQQVAKRARAVARERMARMGVDRDALEALRTLRWDTPAVESALSFLRAGSNELRFLVLCGPKGTGKTVAAAMALQEHLCEDAAQSRPSGNEWAQVDPAVWLLSSTVGRMSLYDREDKVQFEAACRTPLLVIDDYGAEFQSAASRGLLEELFMRRHSGWRRTVMTTNLNPEGLKAHLGERLIDRINTCCLVCVCQGESLRRRLEPTR